MKDLFTKLILMFHTLIVLIWYGLLFVPTNWWKGKIIFHFYLTLGIIGHQLLWGLLILPWVGKYRMVCALTTLTQLLRGKKISDSNNYNHYFTRELFGKVGLTIPHRAVTTLNLTILTIVSIQYFFFR